MFEQDSQLTFLIISGTFLSALMGTFIVAMVVLHRQRQVQNRQKIDNLKAEYERTILNIENEIQQETLAHVGRELHDNIGQLLSLAKLNLNSAKPEKQAEGKEFINQIIKEVRGLSKTLNLDWVEEITLDDFIKQQLQRIESTGYCQTVFDSDHSLNELPKDKKLVLIRVIQECLNNAIKHASPSHISIRVFQNETSRKIEITDDGYGFDTSIQSSGSGMTNLKKRMETIGGSFSLSSTVGKGTQITLNLPF
ncbi:sensor histidine kinase [Algoriphagus sp. AK58]|uniref:sensor histidine kinase n=1 Tax=Algoriphagus sp. AK58 TaxID=1406877 RepID=UPI001650B6E8|nr:ATP-binding protein [Algoriphagus sp. AK58]MBC6367766.1 histidine kinase [Algoriphagus sp. AK58]